MIIPVFPVAEALKNWATQAGPYLSSIRVHMAIFAIYKHYLCMRKHTRVLGSSKRNTELYPSSDAPVHIQLVHCGGLPDRLVLEMRFGGEVENGHYC